MYQGIDVSHHQGMVNWHAVRDAGVKFAAIKVTEGAGYIDPQAAMNVNGARAAGVPIAPYHFLRSTSDAFAQARFFVDTATKLGTWDLIAWCDWESTPGEPLPTLQQVDNFCMTVDRWRACGVYASDSLLTVNQQVPVIHDRKLWVAHYGRPPGQVDVDHWTVHQHSSTGRINGIGTNVDLNVTPDLQALYPPADPAPAPAPKPTPRKARTMLLLSYKGTTAPWTKTPVLGVSDDGKLVATNAPGVLAKAGQVAKLGFLEVVQAPKPVQAVVCPEGSTNVRVIYTDWTTSAFNLGDGWAVVAS